MTTSICVDSHAGWPVEVTQIHTTAEGEPIDGAETVAIVPANSVMTFYVHQTMRIAVREMKRED